MTVPAIAGHRGTRATVSRKAPRPHRNNSAPHFGKPIRKPALAGLLDSARAFSAGLPPSTSCRTTERACDSKPLHFGFRYRVSCPSTLDPPPSTLDTLYVHLLP